MDLTVRVNWDWKKPNLVLLLVAYCCLSTSAQQATQTSQQTNQKIQELAAFARAKPVDTPIGVGDLIHIDVFDVPELSRDVRVSDTGDIGYPLLPGKIAVAGLTPFQLEDKFQQLLIANGLVAHPQVSVLVREQNSQPISVVGAVGHPIVYQVLRPTTLLELLAQAGGVADNAGSVILVTRKARTESESPAVKPASATELAPASNEQTITIRLQDLLESGNPAFNIQVYGGDVVSVPQAGVVYVMGAGIAQPGGYVLQAHGEQITVLKAIALAHGLTGFAKANDAVIMRNNSATGQRDSIPVHIKQIENRKASDVAMKANDILYVPDSASRKVLARTGEAAIGIGTGVAVYRSN
ncbi:MAG: polysaccharide biosynthesis/export family protein [Candidatus Acidiferrales bacterium]